ncbi:protein SOGA3a isoform X2 [Myripristis murdjan]|uniref:protein SOGA3a isoform X2 n=1 Tax=Myripristis murdjan TaxID=586833 RepID=UPI001175CDB1|nr:uncharacterized protein KIAA0408 homolog isoform X2 [Myripristis murdjan]
MWSAFGNGSGLHGGGGAGGGYVPSQGWEFVPCSRMERAERGRGKSRSPLRRISSPPTVFSQILESQSGASSGGGGTPLEVLRGQIWPGPEPQLQPTQHTRLKKKFEDLKRRHGQDKEDWMREKELLLRQVADIQGGENRRILLDLKSVLEEVQVEVKREEEKRSELQLQYTRDKCAWELEKAELKCRIAQLEAREGAGLLSEGVQTAAGPGSAGSRGTSECHGNTSTFRREREEQRRLLADTHSTAMDLRCRLEHNERDWLREKAELLERFDTERREWENQLRDMQRKIEELYCEVRAKREGTELETGVDNGAQDDDVALRLSIRSTSTGSSLHSDQSHSEPISSSSQSEPSRHPPFPGFYRHGNISDAGCSGRSGDSHHSSGFQGNSLFEPNIDGQFTQNDCTKPELVDELRFRSPRQRDSVTDSKDTVDTAELEALFHGAPACGVPQRNSGTSKGNVKNVHGGSQESHLSSELNYGSDKKKNTTALNAALKEIARVSEELCSYQDEIRRKTGDKRNRCESLYLPEEREMLRSHVKPRPELDDSPCDLNQIYDDLRALEKENWISLSPDNTWRTNSTGIDSHRDSQSNFKRLSDLDTDAPPVPPRISSWSLSSPTPPELELHIPESSLISGGKCHSPCALMDRKCSSPSIVRKFEAMLQKNEGKILTDGVIASCSVPANSNCNVGCCHSRWSCDVSKFSSNKLAPYLPVQKSFSEVNILTAGKELSPNYRPGVGNLKSPEGHEMPPVVRELPVDLLLPSLEIPSACPSLQGSRRNIVLEKKTAEFNRTLFQAEMGRGVEEQDNFTTVSPVFCKPVCPTTSVSDEVTPPREANFDVRPQCAEVTSGIVSAHPEVTLSPSILDPPVQNPDMQPRGTRCDSQGQEVRMKQEIPSDLSTQHSEVKFREAPSVTSHNPSHHSEVKHKAPTPNSPSRKTHHRAATEPLFSETILPANTQLAHSVAGSSPKRERPHTAKATASPQQPSAETKSKLMTQPGHQTQPRHPSVTSSQSDTPRPGPRVMNDHPWKPLTLAAYPRPEGSRSNYGAVERILKSYESAAWAQENQNQQNEMPSSPSRSPKQEERVIELLDMLDMDPLPLPPAPRHTHSSHASHTQPTHAQLSSRSAMGVKELRLTVQESKESSNTISTKKKNFSRPARPANRRLPSRWASRSPSSSSSTSSSPSTTPVVPPSISYQKHTSSFTYSHAFHMETVII